MMAPRGLIFDLDGTLVDAFADIATALNRTRAQWGLPALPLEAVRAEVGSGSAHLVRRLVPLPPHAHEAALALYLGQYEAVALEQTRLLPGAEAVLEHFAARPLAVVTNKPLHITRKVLQGLGIWERFRIVLGGDSLERRKPDPLPVRHVLECFALASREALLVGDGPHDISAARAAGVPVVAVTTGVSSRAELEAGRPDRIIDGLEALLTICA